MATVIGKDGIEALTSTPEKKSENINPNITGVPEVSTRFVDKVRKSNPADNIHELSESRKDKMRVVMQEPKEDNIFDTDNISSLNTPSKPPGSIDSNFNASTPLVYGNNADIHTGQLKAKRRNIFNMTPENPEFDWNPVKGAFNVFDKTSSFASGTDTFIGTRSLKKLKRSSNICVNSQSRILDPVNTSSRFPERKAESSVIGLINSKKRPQTDSRSSSKFEKMHMLLSDPQCVCNLTIVVQIILNIIMITIFLGFGIMAFLAVKKDVDRKITTYTNEVVHEINACRREYLRNNCAPEMRVPALEYKCHDWDTCMKKDPESIITSMAYFEVLADCMNAFFHTVSLKSLLGIGCLLLFCILVPNLLFIRFRSYTSSGQGGAMNHDPADDTHALTTSYPMPQERKYKNMIDNGDTQGNISSVRFNPNVSYSMYEYESEEKDLMEPQDEIVNADIHIPGKAQSPDSDDSEETGNQRVILDDD